MKRAADVNNLDGMYWLGRYYKDGYGCEKNYQGALDIWENAARNYHHGDSCNSLGDFWYDVRLQQQCNVMYLTCILVCR
jgi:TPR repeat protein